MSPSDIHALFSELDEGDQGAIDVGQFSRRFVTFQGSFLEKMQQPVRGVFFDGGALLGGPAARREQKLDELDVANDPTAAEIVALKKARIEEESAREASNRKRSEAMARAAAEGRPAVDEDAAEPVRAEAGGAVSSGREADDEPMVPRGEVEGGAGSIPPTPGSSAGAAEEFAAQPSARAGEYGFPGQVSITGPLKFRTFRGGTQKRFYGTITEVIKSRTEEWKPKKHELFTRLPPTRFSRTVWPDTAYVTQPIAHPTVASYMSEDQRLKTMNLSQVDLYINDIQAAVWAVGGSRSSINYPEDIRTEQVARRCYSHKN